MVALAFLCLVLGVLGFLLLVINRPRDADEPTDRLWHLLEEGDITPQEFRRRTSAIQPKLGMRGPGR